MQLLGLEKLPNRCILTNLLHQWNFGIMQLFCCQCSLDSVCKHWTPIDDWPHNSSRFVAVISYYWALHPSQIFFTVPILQRTPQTARRMERYDKGEYIKKIHHFKPDTIFHTAPREMSAIPLRVKYVLSLTGDRTASMTDMFIKPVVCRTDNLPS